MITFFVPGVPAPQGSKTAKCVNGKAIMWEASAKVKEWRATVTATAQIQMIAKHIETITDPVELVLDFRLPKPKSVKRDTPDVKPDLDKLVRAVGDALTKSQIYKDDALVIALSASKSYSQEPGVWISIVRCNRSEMPGN